MTGPYKDGQQVQPHPRQMPTADRMLQVLRDTAPPQGFAAVYESCVHEAAAKRPTAQAVLELLHKLQHVV